MPDTKNLPTEHIQALHEAEVEFKKDPTLLEYEKTMQETREMINDGTRQAI